MRPQAVLRDTQLLEAREERAERQGIAEVALVAAELLQPVEVPHIYKHGERVCDQTTLKHIENYLKHS